MILQRVTTNKWCCKQVFCSKGKSLNRYCFLDSSKEGFQEILFGMFSKAR